MPVYIKAIVNPEEKKLMEKVARTLHTNEGGAIRQMLYAAAAGLKLIEPSPLTGLFFSSPPSSTPAPRPPLPVPAAAIRSAPVARPPLPAPAAVAPSAPVARPSMPAATASIAAPAASASPSNMAMAAAPSAPMAKPPLGKWMGTLTEGL